MKVYEIIQTQEQQLNEGFMNDWVSSGFMSAVKNFVAPAGGKIDKTTRYVGRIRQGSIAIIKALGPIGIPIWNYNQNMLVYDEQLATKKITQDQFDQRHNYEAGMMVAQVAAGLTINLVGEAGIRLIGSLVGGVPIIGYVFGPILRFFSPELTIALLVLLNTNHGRQMIAQFICSSLVKQTEVTVEEIGWNALKISLNDFKDIVAKLLKMTKDEIAELTGQPKPEEAPADPNKPIEPTAQQPAATTTPAQQPAATTTPAQQPAAARATPAASKGDPESLSNVYNAQTSYIPSRFKVDPEGELEFK
jgi:cell division septation protein DedD